MIYFTGKAKEFDTVSFRNIQTNQSVLLVFFLMVLL